MRAASLKTRGTGCMSCRSCQRSGKYECAVRDEVQPVLAKMAKADVIVMATPLYFFSASAQIKVIFDRMFSLYKWDNDTGTMTTPLKGKKLVLIASAFEDEGFDALAQPFILTADYTGMEYDSLLVPDAGVSGDIRKKQGIRDKAVAFGKKTTL